MKPISIAALPASFSEWTSKPLKLFYQSGVHVVMHKFEAVRTVRTSSKTENGNSPAIQFYDFDDFHFNWKTRAVAKFQPTTSNPPLASSLTPPEIENSPLNGSGDGWLPDAPSHVSSFCGFATP